MTFSEVPLDENGLVALVTGGSNGIGREFCKKLHAAGASVTIVDLNEGVGKELEKELNADGQGRALFFKANLTIWEEQVAAFEATVKTFGRVDYAAPIAGLPETPHVPKTTCSTYVKPDLRVIDVDLTAVLYTSSCAIQTFRRQEPNRFGFKGKVICLSSVCGLYTIPTVPTYTAAKHGVVAYVRSFGQCLPKECITLNVVCPTITRTTMSEGGYYEEAEEKGVLCPMSSVQKALCTFLGANGDSGKVLEVEPHGDVVERDGIPPLNEATIIANEIIR